MSLSDTPDNAYAFSLDADHNCFIYYRTISVGARLIPKKEHGRDVRRPKPVIVKNFIAIMHLLKQDYRWVRNDSELTCWFKEFGWGLLPDSIIEKRLSCLLESHTCVKSPIGLFWDVEIRHNRENSHRPPKKVRQCVLERDDYKCIECRKEESDGVKLTMDHVIPFSCGGETTAGNLVTLCESCNARYGNQLHPHLFVLAGLDHDWDPKLLKGNLTSETKTCAVMLSQNIMVSRCKTSIKESLL